MFFFFNDTATTEIYTLSLHDALPISVPGVGPHRRGRRARPVPGRDVGGAARGAAHGRDPRLRPAAAALQRLLDVLPVRKITRLNSSHANISYAVFCLKKKNNKVKVLY